MMNEFEVFQEQLDSLTETKNLPRSERDRYFFKAGMFFVEEIINDVVVCHRWGLDGSRGINTAIIGALKKKIETL